MKLKYFSPQEFECSGVCCFDLMNKDLLQKLDIAREVADVPFIVSSSFRDSETNQRAGGKPNSAHLRGNAVDLLCSNSANRFRILDALLTAGFTRIGIAGDFIHADVDDDLPNCLIWTY